MSETKVESLERWIELGEQGKPGYNKPHQLKRWRDELEKLRNNGGGDVGELLLADVVPKDNSKPVESVDDVADQAGGGGDKALFKVGDMVRAVVDGVVQAGPLPIAEIEGNSHKGYFYRLDDPTTATYYPEHQLEGRAGSNDRHAASTPPATVYNTIPPTSKFDPEYTKRVLDFLVKPGGAVEIRIVKPRLKTGWNPNTSAGWFTDFDAAVKAIAKYDGRAQGIYITLHEIDPRIAARAYNRIEEKPDKTTSDGDVLTYRWLPIDTDPERPSGVSASDDEVLLALQKSQDIANWLDAAGFPLCTPGMSGNGGHNIYRLPDLAANEQNKALIKNVLAALAHRFDDEKVKVDQTLFNPGRVIKLYGTIAAKGDDIPGQPNRRAYLDLPESELTPVTLEQLNWLASQAPGVEPAQRPMQRQNGAHHGPNVSIKEVLDAAGLEYSAEKKNGAGTLSYPLVGGCIFNSDHSHPDAAFTQDASGKYGYHCFHNSCSDKGWKDARPYLEDLIGEQGWSKLFGGKPKRQNERNVDAWTEHADEINTLLSELTDITAQKKAKLKEQKDAGESGAQIDLDVELAQQERLDRLAEIARQMTAGMRDRLAFAVKQTDAIGKSAFLRDVRGDMGMMSNGRPKAEPMTTDDYIALYKTWGYDFRLNLTNDDIENNGVYFPDPEQQRLVAMVRDYGIDNRDTVIIHPTHAQEAITTFALRNKYHPIRDYLNGLKGKWNSEDNIAQMCAHFGNSDGLFAQWFLHWICGAVKKVIGGGFQTPMLTLGAAQGCGKSHWARWICPIPKHFHEGAILPNNKDCSMRQADTFVWEVGELGATTRKADIDALKFFITREQVRDRKPYGRRDTRKPTVSNFIGTWNDDGAGFLVDVTGNRRFLTCYVESIDWSYTSLDVHQIWAQAVHIVTTGGAWELTRLQAEKRDERNQEHLIVDPIREAIIELYNFTGNSSDTETADSVLAHLNRHRSFPANRGTAIQIGKAMKALELELEKRGISFYSKRKTYSGVKRTYYYGIEEKPREDDVDGLDGFQ